ncbi:hypothetical protein [Aromatoleum aromaticum]|uniref:hypothetical protein n=1 Tax=Aromatoleum aromaticum TaxID=551760 RepID=UPI0014595B5B|nr:hypothetical protein [Aromatoleum aromaticum]NMG56603.1 hypothetical protein [Aromatoleum aromaticum]
MARLGRRARQRRIKEIVLGTLAFSTVAAIIVGVVLFIKSQPDALNKQTLCPALGPSGHYVLLVDKTDPLNFTQQKAFAVTLRDLVERKIPEGYLLSVFVLGENFKETAEPLVELCNPGAGEGKSEYTANLVKLRRQYEERFVGPLLTQAEALIATESANASPIIEMLQLVSINAFRKHDVSGVRRLIVMSDMLHNTPQFSMYKEIPDFSSFTTTDYGRKAQLELRQVDVELHYLMNRPQLQTRRNLKFWEDYFDNAGARIVAVRPLEG